VTDRQTYGRSAVRDMAHCGEHVNYANVIDVHADHGMPM